MRLSNEAVILANGVDLSPYLTAASSSLEIDQLDATTFADKKSRRFKPGQKNAMLTMEGFYDHDVDVQAVDDVLAENLSAKTTFLILPSGDGFGMDGYGFASNKSKYEVQTPATELSTVSIEAQSNVGREHVEVLHELGQEAAAGDGSDLDGLAASEKGGVAYLAVTDLSPGETLDVTIEHSADGLSWVELAAFTQADGIVSERVAVAGSVERHVRCSWALSGGTATFHVAFGRKA